MEGGDSKEPKASCHAWLNSSLDEAPGLSRSRRKDKSPRSASSSSASPTPGATAADPAGPPGTPEDGCWGRSNSRSLIPVGNGMKEEQRGERGRERDEEEKKE